MKGIWISVMICLLMTACADMNRMMGKDDSANAGAADQVQESNADERTQAELEPGIHGNIPPGSPFARVETGMSTNRVTDLVGQPTSQKAYTTGKAWIPFYFGSDAARVEYRYKGMGIITFTGGRYNGVYTVYRVIYDPAEEGYMDSN